MKILLDPGHGIPHTGATGRVLGIKEHITTLRVTHVLKSWLEARLPAPENAIYLTRLNDACLITRRDDRAGDLMARGVMAGRIGANLLLSIHCNASTDPRANGYECFTLPGQDQSDVLADELLRSYGRAFPHLRLRADRRDGDLDKEMDLRVLKTAPPHLPKVLFELAFLSNAAEEAWLGNSANYPAIAAALGEGIMSWIRYQR